MKVAILHSGDTHNMKGIMNYVHEKALRFKNRDDKDFECDVFCIRQEYSRLFTWLVLRKKFIQNTEHPISEIIGGVEYNYIWITYGLYDCFIASKLFKHLISFRYLPILRRKLKHYDVLTTHNLECHQFAMMLSKKFAKPFICTWHGSDIHTLPFQKKNINDITRKVIEQANMNFFVSNNLLQLSNSITENGEKQVLYTGPSSIFRRFTEDKRQWCRKQLAGDDRFLFGFVGNLFEVKNVLILPDILAAVKDKLPSDIDVGVQLVIVGDGPLRIQLEQKLSNKSIDAKFLGNVSPEQIPVIMNGLDLLILPSRNEGLPLVTLEALKCGIHVVGSKVGGIPEAIGENNCFDLDEHFVDNISNKIVEIIKNNDVPPSLDERFSWEVAVNKEISLMKSLKRK